MPKLELKWRVFLVVAIGILISTLDSSILNIANPSIAREFGVDINDVQWVVNAYLLVVTSSLILFGRLGDRRGSNRIYTWGFLVFTLGSLGCSMAANLPWLISMRILQGLGASMMMATGIGIVSNIFPDNERGKAMGLTGTIVALGNMLGPGLGGVLLASFKWPVIFLINIPIGILGFYLGLRYLPLEQRDSDQQSFDLPGTVLLAATVTTLLMSLSGNGLECIWLGTSLLMLLVFRWREKTTPSPLLDMDLFKNKIFVTGNLVAVVVYSVQNSAFFLLPFYLESMLGYSPAFSGLMMTTTPIMMAITAPLAGHLSDRYGSPPITALSLALLTGAFLIMSSLQADSSQLPILAALIVLGMGMGTFGSPNTSSILGSMPKQKAGYGGGFIATNRNLSFSLGISLSVLLFSVVLNSQLPLGEYSAAFMQALHTVHLTAAAVTAASLVFWVTWHLTRPKPQPLPSRDTLN